MAGNVLWVPVMTYPGTLEKCWCGVESRNDAQPSEIKARAAKRVRSFQPTRLDRI